MYSVCKSRGQRRLKQLQKVVNVSTQSTPQNIVACAVPQKIKALHNFTTQYSTIKIANLTGVGCNYSTVSTKPITTTTII